MEAAVQRSKRRTTRRKRRPTQKAGEESECGRSVEMDEEERCVKRSRGRDEMKYMA